MVDFRLVWNNNAGDLSIADGDIALDNTLQSAVLVSLFTDARVSADELPDGETDRRGWWGQDVQEQQDIGIGSKLWTLERSKRTDETLERYRGYTAEALQWLVDDGHVRSVDVDATYQRGAEVALDIVVRLLDQDQIEFQFTA